MIRWITPTLALVLPTLFLASAAPGQPTAGSAGAVSPAAVSAAAAPAPPPSPATRTIQGIRNKISAGDLRSAESILEVHRERFGEDGYYIQALGWVARGALLLGEYDRAERYAAELRGLCGDCLMKGANLAKNDSLETALGAAIEVKAQLLARSENKTAAVRYLERELTTIPEPVSLRARIQKRRNILSLAGSAAPELIVEDYLAAPPPPLASFHGRPVLLFLWAYGCGDCKAQSGALARVNARYAGRGLQVVALTRYYEENRLREKAKIDSVWNDVYRGMASAPVVISTASVERYGGSSTPTLVFIDRNGIVRWYTPTRLTEADLAAAVERLLVD